MPRSAASGRSWSLGGLGPLELVERGALPLIFVALVIFFSVNETSGEVFRSGANIRVILANQSVTGLVALAMIIPLCCGYFDLSVAAIAGLANVTSAALIGTHGWPVALGILGALVVALIAGTVNATLVARLKLSAFVITLGTFTLIGGLLVWYTKGATISEGLPASLGNWGSATYLGLPRPFWLLLVVALILWYVLMHTPFGRKLESIGSNERGARLVGITVDRHIFLAFLGSSLLAGIAGVLLTSRSGGADATTAQGYLFPALAAMFLGATTIRPGFYNVWGTLVGVYFIGMAVSGLTLLGATSWVQPVFNGTALIVAVALSSFIGRGALRRDRPAETESADKQGDQEAVAR